MYENIDQQIINALLDDGRASLRNIAEEADVSVTTVSNHLQELESQGAIEGYVPVLNYDELGYDVTAISRLKVSGTDLTDVVDTLSSYDKFVSVYETTGDYDVLVIGIFNDTDEMNAQIKDVLSNSAVEDVNTSVVLNSEKEFEQFSLPIEDE